MPNYGYGLILSLFFWVIDWYDPGFLGYGLILSLFFGFLIDMTQVFGLWIDIVFVFLGFWLIWPRFLGYGLILSLFFWVIDWYDPCFWVTDWYWPRFLGYGLILIQVFWVIDWYDQDCWVMDWYCPCFFWLLIDMTHVFGFFDWYDPGFCFYGLTLSFFLGYGLILTLLVLGLWINIDSCLPRLPRTVRTGLLPSDSLLT